MKLFRLTALVGFSLMGLSMDAAARASSGVPLPTAATVGGDIDDKWCVGKASGAEICVDGQSNLVPIQANQIKLGSATLRFAEIYTTDLDASDDLTVTDDLTVNGDSTLGSASDDTIDLNVTTVTINATINGLKIGTSTTDTTYLFTIDGGSRIIGINDQTPDATLEVVPSAGDAYGLRVSSQNGSTNIFGVDATNQQVEVTGIMGINDTTPDATLEVAPLAADTYALRISSVNGSSDLLAVDVAGVQPDIELSVPARPWARTKAQIDVLAADEIGQLVRCSDCTAPYTLCGSTGTAAGQWQNVASSASLMGVGMSKGGCGTGE